MKRSGATRRALLGGLGAGVAGTALLKSQQDPSRDRETYTYTAYGSEGEFTLRRNRQAFDWVELVPRAMVDVSSVKTATQILGTPMNYPIMVSPSAVHGPLYRDGEMGAHQGAAAASATDLVAALSPGRHGPHQRPAGPRTGGWCQSDRDDGGPAGELL